eukprot:sb/3465069/
MILWLLVQLVSTAALEDNLHKRFEYKHSFKGPSLTDVAGKVPFWDYGGSAMASTDSVRITPSIRSKQGWIWNKIQYVGSNWQVDFNIKVTGRGKIGADGMAMWFLQEIPTKGGSVFGAPNNWKGLGIFFDSFDNDNRHDNPAVLAIQNDGSITFDHGNDGKGQTLGRCVASFRNRPHAAQVRLQYYNKVLALSINPGITTRDSDFEECFKVQNVKLPPGGFFGVSAATGALAALALFDPPSPRLNKKTKLKVHINVLSEDAKSKILTDYERYESELEEKKKKYRENHPGAVEVTETEDEQNLFYRSLIDYQVKLNDKFSQLQLEISKIGTGTTDTRDLSAVKSSVANIERQQSSIVRQIESTGGRIPVRLYFLAGRYSFALEHGYTKAGFTKGEKRVFDTTFTISKQVHTALIIQPL